VTYACALQTNVATGDLAQRSDPSETAPLSTNFASPDPEQLVSGVAKLRRTTASHPFAMNSRRRHELTWLPTIVTTSLSDSFYATAIDGRAASGGEDKTERLWDIGVDPAKQTAILRAHVTPVRSVAFDADTTTLASLSEDGSLRLRDLSGAEPREAARFQGSPGYQALAFAPVGRVLAYGTGGEIRLCRLAGTQWTEQQFCKTDGPAICLAFAPDGRTLASANGGGGLNVWQTATANRLHRWRLPGPAWRVAVAPDGRHLGVGDQFGTIYILRLTAAELGGNKGVPPASGPRP
jgi:WD40 repeat protein